MHSVKGFRGLYADALSGVARRWPVWLLLATLTLPCRGAKRVTVVQLEDAVAALAGEPDGSVAGQLSKLELSEWLNGSRFARLEQKLPGERARQQLMMLADAAVLLEPPTAEVVAKAAPDLSAQRKILAMTVNYVTQTMRSLPNFFATRITASFEDTPALGNMGYVDFKGYQPLHLVRVSDAAVQYRDGHEATDAAAKKSGEPDAQTLTTVGVFGPILNTVLVDAARSKLAWSHWEAGASGPVAVFGYAVPLEKSHYTMNYGCVAPGDAACAKHERSIAQTAAYHGDIAIEAATGTVLRLRLVADPRRGDLAVKYGPVEIGGRSYVCPLRSAAVTIAHAFDLASPSQSADLILQQPLKTSINDVRFEQYHLFRADARVLPEEGR